AESILVGCDRVEALVATAKRLADVDHDQAVTLFARAIDAVEIIRSDSERHRALTRIIWRLGDIGAAHAAALFERAVAVAESILDGHKRSDVLVAVAGEMAAIDPPDPGLLNRALAVAET